ncbi:Haloalkane dehalogenase [Salinisphaera sp. PC39]|uniref:alpha/beta fold hydrolase n=1 Tax=Salinisphaera sp. PC39 TaxID=1304156 RepID=UPI00333E7C58
MLTAPRRPMRRFRPESPTLAIGTLERRHLDLECGRVAYLRHGPTGAPPLLLVHGIPTSARLWEPLLGTLGAYYDCIVPDLLGLGRSRPAAGADLASPGQADMLAAVLDALDIETCLAVFHDQGGAHGAQMLKRHGGRVDAAVFTDCVCYDNWPVPVVDALMRLGPATRPLAATRVLQYAMRVFPWPLTTFRGPILQAAREDWEYALNTGGEALTHWIDYTASQSSHWSQDAVSALQSWTKPAHVIWAAQDRFLPPSWGVELARDIPGADDNPELLPFAGHFWQMEVPATGAAAIHRFFSNLG